MEMVAVPPNLIIDLSDVMAISGNSVSTLIDLLLLASEPSVFWLPAAFVNLLLATLMTPLPVLLASGVKVAV
jgi:hypothetical protein